MGVTNHLQVALVPSNMVFPSTNKFAEEKDLIAPMPPAEERQNQKAGGLIPKKTKGFFHHVGDGFKLLHGNYRVVVSWGGWTSPHLGGAINKPTCSICSSGQFAKYLLTTMSHPTQCKKLWVHDCILGLEKRCYAKNNVCFTFYKH